jgi:hypothetical protein
VLSRKKENQSHQFQLKCTISLAQEMNEKQKFSELNATKMNTFSMDEFG